MTVSMTTVCLGTCDCGRACFGLRYGKPRRTQKLPRRRKKSRRQLERWMASYAELAAGVTERLERLLVQG